MPYQAKVFRILIASPSDVAEERDLVVQCIQEWNDLHSADRKVVLLPLRWETHSRPEYGRRPQEIINRTVVDHCDLLIGIFWTRIGTQANDGRSGTIEEIERVAKGGRPVLLYFSKAKIEPEKIDLTQLTELKAFKSKTLPQALVEHYSSTVDFREKISRHIEMKVRELLAETTENPEDNTTQVVTDLDIAFVDPISRAITPEQIDIQGSGDVPESVKSDGWLEID